MDVFLLVEHISTSLENATWLIVLFTKDFQYPWSIYGQFARFKLGRLMSAVLFDSNAAEMTTAKHKLMKLFELLAWQCYSFGELKFMLGTHTFA